MKFNRESSRHLDLLTGKNIIDTDREHTRTSNYNTRMDFSPVVKSKRDNSKRDNSPTLNSKKEKINLDLRNSRYSTENPSEFTSPPDLEISPKGTQKGLTPKVF
jgi:hypothetical protein